VFTDLDFADDATLLAQMLELLLLSPDVMNQEAQPLGPCSVPWVQWSSW